MDIQNISIIGAGRVGSTMAYLFKGKKNNIVKLKAISSRSQQSLNRVKDLLGSGCQDINYTLDNIEAARDTDCLFIATPDDQI
ncbi:MAG: NAD(P)-binding domain-containing protein [Actinomycetota bacterium]|nr:NAD(P)-binding domain-containing protein [Actinomycetota bacterium]